MGKKSARFAQTMLFLCTLSLAALSDPPDRVYAAAQDQGIISGTCFYDANKNGKRDASDAGMAGIQIKLTKLCIFNSGDNQTATTDAEGNYEFQGLGRGFYRVQAVLEGADQNTSPNPATTRVGIFFKNRTVDFGISRSAVSSTLSLSGHVYLSPLRGEGKASPASGAHIAVSTDINGNGIIEANEAAHATAGTDGSYTVSAPVLLGASTLVAFTKDGYAGLFKTIAVHSTNAISAFDGTLSAMNDLSQDKSGKWKDEAGEVEISNVEISSGRVKVFNPATEADRFPGSFSDNQGNMLISGVFTAFDLNDVSGRKIKQTADGQPARVRMKIPRDTWNVMKDVAPDTDRIDVPMYYFDENTGEWMRGKDTTGNDLVGWLEDANGSLIPEAQLATIRSGSFAGDIYAASDVTHFSYWNVDWPVSTHACIRGKIVDNETRPVAGATITVQGVTYAGTSSPQISDENGEFCVDVMRSEGADEDIDNNGSNGDTQKVLVTVVAHGTMYRFGEYAVTSRPGSCPSGCMLIGDNGTIPVTPEHEVQVTRCTINGRVLLEGLPTEGVMVYAYDDMLDPMLWHDVCGTSYEGCSFFAESDTDGLFSVTAPYAVKLLLSGYYIVEDEVSMFWYSAQKGFTQCPAVSVDLNLELTYCFVDLPVITYTNGTIDWEPEIKAMLLMVLDGTVGTIKWYIMAEDENGFSLPVTYGTVPDGAVQVMPTDAGKPAAVSSGDMIYVFPAGGTIPYKGHNCFSTTMGYVVP